MEAIERIKEIAIYLNDIEFTCTKCGTINTLATIDIIQALNVRHIPYYKAMCPDCNSYIRRMKNTKAERIWYKGSMQEIAKLDTSLLMWMLSTPFTTNIRERAAITAVLKTRVVGTCEAPQTMTEIKAQAALDKKNASRNKVEEMTTKKLNLQQAIRDDSINWTYGEIQAAYKKLKAYTFTLKQLE
jgi:hypothetical protein